MTDDDAALLRRARSGDDAAAQAFYRRHVEYVWSIVRRFSFDDDDAMDAAQDAFLRVFRGAQSSAFDGRSSIRTWLFRVASSAAIDFARSPRARRHVALTAAVDTPVHESPSDPALRARIADGIARLPAAERETFVLCVVMGQDHGEAATTLGISVSSSRRRLADAKARLRRTLARVIQEWSE